MNKDRIDDLLLQHFARQPDDDDNATGRVMTRLARPLPRQKFGLWKSLPGVLLDWQFAPSWPRVAVLGACAAFGFFIGIAGFDARVNDASARLSVASGDLSSVFEPEPLTGARP